MSTSLISFQVSLSHLILIKSRVLQQLVATPTWNRSSATFPRRNLHSHTMKAKAVQTTELNSEAVWTNGHLFLKLLLKSKHQSRIQSPVFCRRFCSSGELSGEENVHILSACFCPLLTFVLVSWSAHVEKDNFRNTWVTPQWLSQWTRSHLSLIFHVFITTGLIWKSTKASKHHTDQQRRAREAMRAGRMLPDTSSCVQMSCKLWKVGGVRLKTEVKSVWNGWLLNASKMMTVMKMWGEWWMRAVSGEAASAAEHGAAKNEK